MRFEYPVDLFREADGTISVTFDGLPGATWGADSPQALSRAADALVTVLSGFIDDGVAVPAPAPARGRPLVSLGALEAAKIALHNAMLAAGISNVELAQRIGIDEKAVRRLRDPLHRSHIGQVEAALKALGQRLAVEVRQAAA
jgi:antitoxin HicB